MLCLQYQNGELYIENVKLSDIAKQYGTPSYIYSRTLLENNWREFDNAFKAIPHRICYSVKANSNLAILNLLAKLNSGFDIVSLGELERVLAAGGDPQKIIFSGVGKSQHEITRAIQAGIYCFDVESEPELERLNTIANQLNTKVNIALRVNPDIDALTHSHLSTGLVENKFGIESNKIMEISRKLSTFSGLQLIGLACHIGSQMMELKPFLSAIDRLLEIYQQLQASGFKLRHINVGGGLGITYSDEQPPTIQEYANALKEKLGSYPIELIMEPGRAIVGNAGILLTRIEYLKHTSQRNFAIVDAGMNDLMRPALYNAWQNILPILARDEEKKYYDIAGPVCESSDFLGKHRKLAIRSDDLLAVEGAGAYGFSMSSNYNSRMRPVEILVSGNTTHLIRRRENIKDLIELETIV